MLERWQHMIDEAVARTLELLSGLGTGELDEEEDGCALDFTVEPTADEDVDGVVLFAGVDPGDVPDLAEAWRLIAEGDDRA